MDGWAGILFSTRDISAVCYGLQQFCSKDSLHLEQNYCKSLQTFAGKSLIMLKIEYLPSLLLLIQCVTIIFLLISFFL